MIKSNLCDYSDVYIFVKGIITASNKAAAGTAINNTNEKVMFKNCAPFTDCITEINNTQVDEDKKTDTVMPIYNLIEYSDAYFKTIGSLRQYFRDQPDLDANDNINDFPANNNISASLKFKQQITGRAGKGGIKISK